MKRKGNSMWFIERVGNGWAVAKDAHGRVVLVMKTKNLWLLRVKKRSIEMKKAEFGKLKDKLDSLFSEIKNLNTKNQNSSW